MKKLVLLAMLAISLFATAATVMASDNPVPDCSGGMCDWLR